MLLSWPREATSPLPPGGPCSVVWNPPFSHSAQYSLTNQATFHVPSPSLNPLQLLMQLTLNTLNPTQIRALHPKPTPPLSCISPCRAESRTPHRGPFPGNLPSKQPHLTSPRQPSLSLAYNTWTRKPWSRLPASC